jgi:hypothetical protein
MGRVEKFAKDLLEKGRVLCKYDLSALAHCDQRTAQRVLKKIHASHCGVRISRWVPIYRHLIPMYFRGPGVDMPKPEPKTSAQRAAKRRKDPEVRWDELMAKRAKRLHEKYVREACHE